MHEIDNHEIYPGWNRDDVGGVAVDWFRPEPLRARVLFLRDYDEAVPDIPSLLSEHGMGCVAPDGGVTWWTRTAETLLIDAILPWSTGVFGRPANAIVGIGSGGQAALRLGFRYPERFPVVVSIDGACDFHELHGEGTPLDTLYPRRESARQDTPVLQVRPHDFPPHIWFACDPDSRWFRGNDRLHEKLNAVGVRHEFHADLDRETALRQGLTFATAALEKQSRRLL